MLLPPPSSAVYAHVDPRQSEFDPGIVDPIDGPCRGIGEGNTYMLVQIWVATREGVFVFAAVLLYSHVLLI